VTTTPAAHLPVALIVAVAENHVIGVTGGLPWRLKADLKKFRAITMGKPLIMGRKTFESIGRVLDGRDIIVVTRQKDFSRRDTYTAPNLDAALKLAAERAAARNADEICVVGGGEMYAAAMPLADRLYVTHIAARPDGDTLFPEISPADWSVVSREALPKSGGDTVTGEHVVYGKRR
jgi:dihydrofolate reductase